MLLEELAPLAPEHGRDLGKPIGDQIQAGDDVGERIVDLVRDAGGEGTERRHAIGEHELGLELAAVADVAHHHHRAQISAAVVLDGTHRQERPHLAAALRPEAELAQLAVAAAASEEAAGGCRGLLVHEVEDRLSPQIGGRVLEHLGESAVREGGPSIGVHQPDSLDRRLDDLPIAFLGGPQRRVALGSLRRHLLLAALLLAEIGGDDALGDARIHRDLADRDEDGFHRSIFAAKLELALAHREKARLQERGNSFLRRAREDPEDGGADDPLGGQAEYAGESRVAIRDQPVLGEGSDALAHLVHEDAVVVIGAGEREDPIAARSADDDGVHLAAADRLQRLFRFEEALAQGAVGPRLAGTAWLGAPGPLRHRLAQAPQIEPDEHFLPLRKIADETA